MALVNMAIADEAPESYEDNPYGYGLCIRLNPNQSAALGISTPPPAGTKMMIHAMAVATRVTEEADLEEGGGSAEKEVYLELQITDMQIDAPGNTSAKEDAATMLYGE